LFGLLVGNGGWDDHVISRLPIYGRGYAVLGVELDGIEDAEDFVKIASAAHGVDQHEFDFFVGTDHKYGANRRVVGGRAAFAAVARFGGQHVVEFRNFEFRIADHGIVHLMTLRLLNVAGPLAVAGDGIDAESDDFRVALGELRLQAGHIAQFGGAYRGEILWVRKEDGPSVADPFVKVDRTLRGFGGKVRCFRVDA